MLTELEQIKILLAKNGIPAAIHKVLSFILFILRHPVLFLRLSWVIWFRRRLRTDRYRHVYKLANYCCYLTGSSKNQQVKAFIFHHQYLDRALSERFFNNKTPCWKLVKDENELKINFEFSYFRHAHEGEGSVVLYLNGASISYMSFLFVSNNFEIHEGLTCLLITRHQGIKGHIEKVKVANKLLSNMNMAYALLSALEGLCKYLDISVVYGVTTARQLSSSNEKGSGNFGKMYDELWKPMADGASCNGLYKMSVPFKKKKATHAKTSHASRHAKHSAIKAEISTRSCDSIRFFLDNPANRV